MRRECVEVTVRIDRQGDMHPLSIIWSDGRELPIHRVQESELACDPETGERGRRYTVTIRSRSGAANRYLYRFGRRWYVYPMQRCGWV